MSDEKPPDKVCRTCLYWKPNRVEVTGLLAEDRECWEPHQETPFTADEFTCKYHVGAEATWVNVPQHTPKGMHFRNEKPVDGPVEILIVTYWKDEPWLEYCLKCIQKHCRGFQGVTVATPHPAMRGVTEDSKFIKPEFFDRMSTLGPVRIRAVYYDEVPSKGFVQHELMMARAETIVPPGTKYVLLCDADCMYRMPTTPEDYFWQDKPHFIIRSWESLTTEDPRNPGSKVVSDCLQWKGPTDEQLGFDSKVYTMCMNTTVFPIDFFPKYREQIKSAHKMQFDDYMMEGISTFPQNRMDHTAMGAYGYNCMNDRWHWFWVESGEYPEDRKLAFWSHGGISPEIMQQIEGFLK